MRDKKWEAYTAFLLLLFVNFTCNRYLFQCVLVTSASWFAMLKELSTIFHISWAKLNPILHLLEHLATKLMHGWDGPWASSRSLMDTLISLFNVCMMPFKISPGKQICLFLVLAPPGFHISVKGWEESICIVSSFQIVCTGKLAMDSLLKLTMFFTNSFSSNCMTDVKLLFHAFSFTSYTRLVQFSFSSNKKEMRTEWDSN